MYDYNDIMKIIESTVSELDLNNVQKKDTAVAYLQVLATVAVATKIDELVQLGWDEQQRMR